VGAPEGHSTEEWRGLNKAADEAVGIARDARWVTEAPWRNLWAPAVRRATAALERVWHGAGAFRADYPEDFNGKGGGRGSGGGPSKRGRGKGRRGMPEWMADQDGDVVSVSEDDAGEEGLLDVVCLSSGSEGSSVGVRRLNRETETHGDGDTRTRRNLGKRAREEGPHVRRVARSRVGGSSTVQGTKKQNEGNDGERVNESGRGAIEHVGGGGTRKRRRRDGEAGSGAGGSENC
jgi:hypothetical protein